MDKEIVSDKEIINLKNYKIKTLEGSIKLRDELEETYRIYIYKLEVSESYWRNSAEMWRAWFIFSFILIHIFIIWKLLYRF